MLRFDTFNILAEFQGASRRIAKLIFRKDGSLFVTFPSFCDPNGIAACGVLRANAEYPLQVNLAETGKITSHLVKYSWHPDGRAHFSQDGKVRTEIKRMACPIRAHEGHVFTIQVQTLDGFPVISSNRKIKASDLRIQIAGDPIKVLRIVAYRYSVKELNKRSDGKPIPDFAQIATPTGVGPAFFVGSPVGIDPETVFVLALHQSDWISADHKPTLTFIGGFDPPPVAFDHSKEFGFLALNYPCSDPEELKKRLGSIDLVSKVKNLP